MIARHEVRPVRRSPLDAVHERLGARWRAPGIRWPQDYGDSQREAAIAQAAAVLVDWGPVEAIAFKGPAVARALAGAAVDFRPGTIAQGSCEGEDFEVWGSAPDEALVLHWNSGAFLGRIDPRGVAIVRLSSALTVLRLVGPKARWVLMELLPVDLSEPSFADLRVVHAPVANVLVSTARRNLGSLPAFTILAPRDYAAYLWEALLHCGGPHGLVPAGALAIERT